MPAPGSLDLTDSELARLAESDPTTTGAPAPGSPGLMDELDQISLGPDKSGSGPPRRAVREDRQPKDAATGTESPSDWTRFDVSRSLRVLRNGSENACKLELRKLHLRLWHAGRQSMTQILRAAGVTQKVLDMVPAIIQTCAECRKWQRPMHATQHALSASVAFNQHVEFDLLFYRQHIVCHAICRATRWHAATVVTSKEGEILQEALFTMWIAIHGPMTNLISDGEGGLWRSDIAERLKRQGINMKLRAPQQHARYIERRGAVLRATLHVMHEQLERESVQCSFPTVLAEAVFAGNALTHVGGSTPYQAVYGRQPAMLPPLDAPDLPSIEEISSQGDHQRERVRRAALEAMMQATSMVVVKIQGVDGTYRAQDVRHALLVFFAEHQPSKWELTATSKARPHVLHALEHLLQSCWRIGDACSVRLAHGVRHLCNVPHASHSTLLWWHKRPDEDVQFCTLEHTKVDLLEVIGQSYSTAFVVQAIQSADQDVSLLEACDSTSDISHETGVGTCLPDSDGEHPSVHTPHGPLSAIAEEPGAEEEAEAYLAQVTTDEAEIIPALREIFQLSLTETLEPVAEVHQPASYYAEPILDDDSPVDPHCHYRLAGLDPETYGSLQEQDEQGNGYVEVWFTKDFAKVIGDPDQLHADETYALRVYAAGFRNAVIQRESDLLTTSEIRQNQAAVDAATLEELRIWMKYGCFERAPRASSYNVMDSKFVTKWKKTKNPQGQEVRIIRQRLALRGFKDLQADQLEAHASTGSRMSQRLLCSEAACRPHWRFVALDISKAFLQGMTYKEIASRTGEEERDVCFTLPPAAVKFLKQLEGFESFNEHEEVLRCVKPGTGCKDAPSSQKPSLQTVDYTIAASLTAWAAVFVIALQRRTSNPLNIHVRRLNLLLAAMQRKLCKVVFPAMTCQKRLVAFSDASFDKEGDSKGYGMRGSVFLRWGINAQGKEVCHMLEAQSQSLKLVTRSTFSSETLAAVGTVDQLVPMLFAFQEILHGPLTSQQARTLREKGGFTMTSELVIDAMNLFWALSVTSPRMPAERTLFVHINWLRDLLQAGMPSILKWMDTRGMLADGMTKGKIDRGPLVEAMAGQHAMHPVTVNRHLLKDLINKGLWTEELRTQLIAHNGSVQQLDLPQDMKDLYKTVWEIRQKRVLDLAADRGAYIDQSQSLNIHMMDCTTAKLSSMHFHGWQSGLKTGMYYLRTKAAADAIKFTVDVRQVKKAVDGGKPKDMGSSTDTCASDGYASKTDTEQEQECSILLQNTLGTCD
ncbi:RNR1 [Symbiodinium sp. CCMP2592]|nr:RNR1 [Symbiodinium sp. CCMP2592]